MLLGVRGSSLEERRHRVVFDALETAVVGVDVEEGEDAGL